MYTALDPHSIPQQLAYYELYPDTREGQQALERASLLLGADLTQLPTLDLAHLVDLLAKQGSGSQPLDQKQLEMLSGLGDHLLNRRLPGRSCTTEAQVLALPPEQLDLSRALLLSLYEGEMEQVQTYEALLDLMALQILARTSFHAPPEEKIRVINWFLFDETHLRFPPHSLWTEEIDHYTFLPSVLDSRRGVCLGVSALYLCLAQRLGLDLEAVTPPGHIYLRTPGGKINIETTARGIHIPSEHYLSVHTKSLQTHNIKEVVGLTFQNQASALWQAGKIDEAIQAYEKALLYLPDDPLITELLGTCCFANGQKKRGEELLALIVDHQSPHAVAPNTLPEDILSGNVDAKGVEALFQHVDETRTSILEKQERLQTTLRKYPKFRAGWLQLATTHLQLGRGREALAALHRYHALDAGDPTVEYYLAALSLERSDYNAAWSHLHTAEAITGDYSPKPLKALRHGLRLHAPEPRE